MHGAARAPPRIMHPYLHTIIHETKEITMTKKSGNPVDAIVGRNIHHFRNQCGMSQEKLGEALGITFQQIQKYEKGANRVSASALVSIAKALGTGIPALFVGTDAPMAEAPPRDKMIDRIASVLRRIPDPSKRESVLRVAEALL
jgi:transcriptional regulator with XRE-family HTH domain